MGCSPNHEAYHHEVDLKILHKFVATSIKYYHIWFQEGFSSPENCMGYNPRMASVNPKHETKLLSTNGRARICTSHVLTSGESRDLCEPWPNTIGVKRPWVHIEQLIPTRVFMWCSIWFFFLCRHVYKPPQTLGHTLAGELDVMFYLTR